VKRSVLQAKFGINIANLVWAVTDEVTMGDNRKIRKVKTYAKIRQHDAGSAPWATSLKLADRLANVWAARARSTKLRTSKYLTMYRKEQAEFEHELRFGNQLERTWQLLNGLLRP
jgi:(p)ppGpp synthase/HD superfamily hydrolase